LIFSTYSFDCIWLNTSEEDLDYSVVVYALTNTVLPYVLETFGIWLVLLASQMIEMKMLIATNHVKK